MVKHTLKILRCEHRKIFKVCLAIYNIMHERVNATNGNQKKYFFKMEVSLSTLNSTKQKTDIIFTISLIENLKFIILFRDLFLDF